MNEIEKQYIAECNRGSDIYQHLPTLKKYAEQCKHITEMGVRDIVSTWAFLMGNPEKMISYDINNPPVPKLKLVINSCNKENIAFAFIKANVLDINIEQTDILFIDTLHRGSQLKKELELHSNKVNKYIILHDTTTFYNKGEDNNHRPTLINDGLGWALEEFIQKNPNWITKEVFKNNNGLTILERTV